MLDIESSVRKLAKSNKYQTLYCHFKECGLPLFRNQSDYTAIQVLFLNYMGFYYNLFTEIALNNVDPIVTTDEIYEDAYMYYKNKQRVKELTGEKKPSFASEKQTAKDKGGFSWVFKKPKK